IGPNRLSKTSLVLWANNWDTEGSESGPSYGTLGVDLKGSLQAIPEPSTVLVIGTGLAGLIG
ncbi:MAG: PEP-CTERM sorting domain-containing protein, partial [Nitrospirota bacterium]|nr:PEP-CTERM sorting domain-containing protein [Nitrospirota bacterium]